ncbi:MAG: F0F1 ATP synthase subunit delta [Actinomycetota bacterium]
MTFELTEFGGTSRKSLAASRKVLDEILESLTNDDVVKLAADLFSVVATLDSSTPLRRALTDGSRDTSSKSKLTSDIFGKAISSVALKLLTNLIEFRWSNPSNISDAIEHLAVEAEAHAANSVNELDLLEDELFAFARIVASNRELRQVLNSTKFLNQGKRSLIADLLGKQVSSSSERMLGHLVCGLRGRNIESTIALYSVATGARKERSIVHIRSSVALTEKQKVKLVDTLSQKIGKPIRLNVEIDATVLGGFSIRFADELIDATIVSRLADASRALAV